MKRFRPRFRWDRRARVLVLVVVVASVVLWVSLAASHSGLNSDRLNAIRQAPDRALKSQRFETTMTISLVPRQGLVHYTTETGQLDAAHNRASLLLSDVVSPLPGGLRVISQGDVLYLLLTGAGQARFPGKRWVAVKLDSVAAAQGAAIGPIPDPLSFLAGLRGAVGTVRAAGDAAVDGTATTAYTATIDLNAVLSAVGPEGAVQVQALQRLGGPELPVEVWLDAEGRPRQLRVHADLGARGSIVVEVKFGNFGQPLIIGIPPVDAVVNAPSLAAALAIAGVHAS